mmetsp:Transcript_98342/g.283802  ORF Transcript_98342/g.283802 Transcript_98342/m.283802 type:complete len:209 (-) Transcript_98342:551-1177(-)
MRHGQALLDHHEHLDVALPGQAHRARRIAVAHVHDLELVEDLLQPGAQRSAIVEDDRHTGEVEEVAEAPGALGRRILDESLHLRCSPRLQTGVEGEQRRLGDLRVLDPLAGVPVGCSTRAWTNCLQQHSVRCFGVRHEEVEVLFELPDGVRLVLLLPSLGVVHQQTVHEEPLRGPRPQERQAFATSVTALSGRLVDGHRGAKWLQEWP